MNEYIFQIYRLLVPKALRTAILKKNLKAKIQRYYESLPLEKLNDEQIQILEFLETNPVEIFPYCFYDHYSPKKIEVFLDKKTGMRFVFQDGKRLFFKKRWGEKRIKKAYSSLEREQDIDSPHRYLTDSFSVNSEDVLADIGAAEGNFSLSVIEKVKKIYLFEHDHEWTEALQATFGPWSEKVEIIDKYVSDRDDRSHIRFDTFFGSVGDINLVKIDVDGAESIVLDSCNSVFRRDVPLRVLLCTYHKNNDEREFASTLQDQGFSVAPSNGYMIHYYDKKMKAPYLRRGLLRAEK